MRLVAKKNEGRPSNLAQDKQMQSNLAEAENQLLEDPAADYQRELKKLSAIAFAFLNAADGDKHEAEAMLDDFVDLLFEGGALSTWRYRILLAAVREGR